MERLLALGYRPGVGCRHTKPGRAAWTVAAATGGAALLLGGAGPGGTAAAATTGPAAPAAPAPVVQPPPPVSATDFAEEPAGAAPADGDGLIPNPATPTGEPVGPPTSCTVTFAAAAGATSGTVNAWISANENQLTAPTAVCLAGAFHQPLHVWGKTTTALLTLAPAPGASASLELGQLDPSDTDPNQYWSRHRRGVHRRFAERGALRPPHLGLHDRRPGPFTRPAST